MTVLFDDLSAVQLAILLGGSLLAGILNAISGGGGMILIPLMILTGIPPINAIAINKFQNTVGAVAAISHYNTRQKMDWNILVPFLILAGIGAAFGAFALKGMAETGILMVIMPYVLIAVAIYSILPGSSQTYADSRYKHRIRTPIWAMAGVYGGSIGIGTGPFMIALDRFFYGSELRDAIVRTKPIMFIINIVSLTVLVALGFVIWPVALLLSVGNLLGAKLGAKIVTLSLEKLATAIVFIVPLVAALHLLMQRIE